MLLKSLVLNLSNLTLSHSLKHVPKLLNLHVNTTRTSQISKLNKSTDVATKTLAKTNNSLQSKKQLNPALEEFFDDPKGETVKHGRAWSLDELRLKNNTDLHQLWYVLHKERNMLLTMEQIYININQPMPSHERIAKVNYI